jgi:hypothetical protein
VAGTSGPLKLPEIAEVATCNLAQGAAR